MCIKKNVGLASVLLAQVEEGGEYEEEILPGTKLRPSRKTKTNLMHQERAPRHPRENKKDPGISNQRSPRKKEEVLN